MKNSKIFGAVLFIVGFIILIINAADYLGGFFGWGLEVHLPSSGVGVAFLVIGMLHLSVYPAASKPVKGKKS